MKRIYNFNQFNKIFESENDSDKDKKKGEETPFRDASILVTLFASELAEHIKYWFSYGDFKDSNYVLKDMKEIKSNIEKTEFWLDEYNSDDEKIPMYTWRIKYIPLDPEQDKDDPDNIKRVSRVRLILDVFDYANQNRLKNYEVEIPIDKISSNKLKDKMTWMKSKIIKTPKSKKDISKFNRRQDRNLRDDVY